MGSQAPYYGAQGLQTQQAEWEGNNRQVVTSHEDYQAKENLAKERLGRWDWDELTCQPTKKQTQQSYVLYHRQSDVMHMKWHAHYCADHFLHVRLIQSILYLSWDFQHISNLEQSHVNTHLAVERFHTSMSRSSYCPHRFLNCHTLWFSIFGHHTSFWYRYFVLTYKPCTLFIFTAFLEVHTQHINQPQLIYSQPSIVRSFFIECYYFISTYYWWLFSDKLLLSFQRFLHSIFWSSSFLGWYIGCLPMLQQSIFSFFQIWQAKLYRSS